MTRKFEPLPYEDEHEREAENELVRFAVVVALIMLGVFVLLSAMSIAARFDSLDAYLTAAFG